MQLCLKMQWVTVSIRVFIFISKVLRVTTNVTPVFSPVMENPNWERSWSDVTPITFQPEIFSRLGSESCNCIESRLCPEFLDLLQYRSSNSEDLRRLTCGFQGFSPMVCCNQVLSYHPNYYTKTERFSTQSSQDPREYSTNCNPFLRSITTVRPRINLSTTPQHTPGNYYNKADNDQPISSNPYFQPPTVTKSNEESGFVNGNRYLQNPTLQYQDNGFVTQNPLMYSVSPVYTKQDYQTNKPMTPRAFPDYYVKTHDVYNHDYSPHDFSINQRFPINHNPAYTPYNHSDFNPTENHKFDSPGHWSTESHPTNFPVSPTESYSAEYPLNRDNDDYMNYSPKVARTYNNGRSGHNYPFNYIPNYYPDYPTSNHNPGFHSNTPSYGYYPKNDKFHPPHHPTIHKPGFRDPNFFRPFHTHHPHPPFQNEHKPTEPWYPPKYPPYFPSTDRDTKPFPHPGYHNTHGKPFPTGIPFPNPSFNKSGDDVGGRNLSRDMGDMPRKPIPPVAPQHTPRKDEEERRTSKRKLLPENECGVVSIGERIVGGKTALLGAYPWIARLGYTRSGSDQVLYRCGASLISDRYVITAAHCVTNLPGQMQLATIRLGELDERTNPDCDQAECADPVEDFTPLYTRVHNNYDTPKFTNDLALIRLDRPVNFTAYISPICLPFESLRNKSYTGLRSVVAGWGATDLGATTASSVLQWVQVTVLPAMVCARAYAERAGTRLGPGQICAGGERGRDSCEGDSGGPLMRGEQLGPDDFQRYFLLGVVSFGARRCGLESLPGVYTNIPDYVDWILDNIDP